MGKAETMYIECPTCHGRARRVYRREWFDVCGIGGLEQVLIRFPAYVCQPCELLLRTVESEQVIRDAENEFALKQAELLRRLMHGQRATDLSTAQIALSLGFGGGIVAGVLAILASSSWWARCAGALCWCAFAATWLSLFRAIRREQRAAAAKRSPDAQKAPQSA